MIYLSLPEMCRSQVLDLLAHDMEAGTFNRSVAISLYKIFTFSVFYSL